MKISMIVLVGSIALTSFGRISPKTQLEAIAFTSSAAEVKAQLVAMAARERQNLEVIKVEVKKEGNGLADTHFQVWFRAEPTEDQENAVTCLLIAETDVVEKAGVGQLASTEFTPVKMLGDGSCLPQKK